MEAQPQDFVAEHEPTGEPVNNDACPNQLNRVRAAEQEISGLNEQLGVDSL